MRSFTKLVFVFAFVAAVLLGVSQKAEATLIVTITDGFNTHIVVDEGASGDLTPGGILTTHDDGFAGTGTVMLNGAIGNFLIQATIAISKPNLGPATLHVNNVSVSSIGGGTLTIAVTDTDFTLDPLIGSLLEGGGVTAGTVTVSSFADPDNLENATGSGLLAGIVDGNNVAIENGDGDEHTLSLGPFSGGAFSGSTSSGFVPVVHAPFSQTVVVTVTHAGNNPNQFMEATSFDFEVSAVPEPSSVAVWGLLGLAGFFGYRTRKRKALKA